MKKLCLLIGILSTCLFDMSIAEASTNVQSKDVQVNTSTFSKNLNSSDNTVQKALNTIDQTAGSGGGGSPAGATGNIQTNGGGGSFGAFNGSTCGGQIANAISASGALSCVNYFTLTSLSATSPITYNNTTGAIGWTNSQNYITLTALNSTMSGLTYNNGTGTFSLTPGFYFPTTTDQTNWNAKQAAGNYITSLAGDITGTGPGAATTTLATVNANVGTWNTVTVNGKGLVTAGSNTSYQTPLSFSNSLQNTAGTVNLVGDSTSPGNSFYYGTNGSGTKGFYTIPSQVYPGAGIANSTGSGWGTSYTTTGSGTVAVLATSPTLVTPALGVASATSINKVTITAPATSATLTISDGKTTTINNSLTLGGTDGTTMTFPSTSATIARTDASNTFTGHQTIEGVTSTGATGTGNLVFSVAPNFTGNVGIGSATPGQALDIQGTARMTGLYITGLTASRPMFTAAGGQASTGFVTGNTTTVVSATGSLTPGDFWKIDASGNAIDGGPGIATPGGSNTQVQFNSSGVLGGAANLVYTGNVGIGSATPGKILDVQGTIRTTAFTMSGQTPINGYVLTATDSAGDTTWLPATGSGGTPTTGTNMLFGNGSGAYANVTNTGASGGNIGIGTTTALNQLLTVQGNIAVQGNTGPTYFMNTNVGIGSLTPGQALDVQGTVRMVGFTMPTGANSGYVLTSNGVGIGTWQPAGTGSGTVTNVTASSPLASSGGTTPNITVNSSTGTGAIVLQTSPNLTANVGIGSATPGAALDVNGAIRSTNNAPSNFVTNVGIGSITPGQALDVQGTVRISNATPMIWTNCKATTGTRYVCVDISGNVSCSASACSGT